jgi:hypothetical protein
LVEVAATIGSNENAAKAALHRARAALERARGRTDVDVPVDSRLVEEARTRSRDARGRSAFCASCRRRLGRRRRRRRSCASHRVQRSARMYC